MTDTLMVGVSGVRGIVGKDLTADVVTRWATAFGTWALESGKGERGKGTSIVVGRDARTSGPAFAAAVTAGLTSVGCDVIDVGLVPTPTVQLAVEHHRAGGGIAITASHNPIEWNALKFIGADGIFLDGADGKRVADLAAGPSGSGKRETLKDSLTVAGNVTADRSAVERHLDAVLKLPALDVEQIRKIKFTVALDAVRGAGGPVMRALLERLGCEVAGINLETDGQFPRPPEPIPENLGGLSTLVKRSGAALGIAVDPDVDRLAIVDENGVPIGEDYTLAFAIRAVLGGKRERGNPKGLPDGRGKRVVVCNLSTSLVVEDAAGECGAEVVRTPVGEVHVARAILRLGAVIGGEGNGGVMYPVLHAGRDAPVAAALLLTLLARDGRRVSELVAAAPRYAIVKAKLERGAGSRERGLERAYAELRRRFADAQVDAQDGLRLAWRDRWLHVRPSNTEPIIRLIAEAPSGAGAQQLVDEGRRICAAS
jgi:phosphomannomutase